LDQKKSKKKEKKNSNSDIQNLRRDNDEINGCSQYGYLMIG
jgi:hypothetical protein